MSNPRTRTPVEVVDTYLDVLYNQRRLDLIPDLIADPTWRHAPGKISKLTLQANRVRQASITNELMEIIGGAEAIKG